MHHFRCPLFSDLAPGDSTNVPANTAIADGSSQGILTLLTLLFLNTIQYCMPKGNKPLENILFSFRHCFIQAESTSTLTLTVIEFAVMMSKACMIPAMMGKRHILVYHILVEVHYELHGNWVRPGCIGENILNSIMLPLSGARFLLFSPLSIVYNDPRFWQLQTSVCVFIGFRPTHAG
jgi:hypothetical protein